MSFKILPSITTTNYSSQNNFEKKIDEAQKLKIKELSVFLTGFNLKKRQKAYRILKRAKIIKKIPFVHLRSDMALWELDFLVEHYQTKIFNLHSAREFPLEHDLSKYQNQIYIENTWCHFIEGEIKNSAGICIDFAHLESDRLLRPKIYQENLKIIRKYPCGCAHLSAFSKTLIYYSKEKIYSCDSHHLKDFSQLVYLKRYRRFLPKIMAIELENNLEEQLKIKNYLQNHLLSGLKIC